MSPETIPETMAAASQTWPGWAALLKWGPLAISSIGLIISLFSKRDSKRSADASETSAREAKRSADIAEEALKHEKERTASDQSTARRQRIDSLRDECIEKWPHDLRSGLRIILTRVGVKDFLTPEEKETLVREVYHAVKGVGGPPERKKKLEDLVRDLRSEQLLN